MLAETGAAFDNLQQRLLDASLEEAVFPPVQRVDTDLVGLIQDNDAFAGQLDGNLAGSLPDFVFVIVGDVPDVFFHVRVDDPERVLQEVHKDRFDVPALVAAAGQGIGGDDGHGDGEIALPDHGPDGLGLARSGGADNEEVIFVDRVVRVDPVVLDPEEVGGEGGGDGPDAVILADDRLSYEGFQLFGGLVRIMLQGSVSFLQRSEGGCGCFTVSLLSLPVDTAEGLFGGQKTPDQTAPANSKLTSLT